jgi:hypothetical protein
MKATHTNIDTVKQAAEEVDLQMAYEPYEVPGGFRFRVLPTRDEDYRKENGHYRWQRRSAGWSNTERRIFATCWHGHREFFRALFRLDPNARIYTALCRRCNISYWTGSNFEDKFRETGYVNIGSHYRPVQAREACFCSETGDDYDTGKPEEVLKEAEVKTFKRSKLSDECWPVQFSGLGHCKNCEYLDHKDCGGQDIRKTGKNRLGFNVPLGASK